MKTLAELLAMRKAAVDAAAAIEAAADAAGGAMTAEQKTQFEAHLAEAEKLDAQIKRKQQLGALQERAAVGPGRAVPPSAIGAAEAALGEDPHLPAQARRPDSTRGFASPRDFLMSVMRAGRRGNVDARLRPLAVDEAGQIHATAGSDEQGGYAEAYGGFLVPEAFSPNLLALQGQGDPLAGLVTRIPMSGPSVKLPARVDKSHSTSVTGGLRFYRRSETATVTASRMALEQITLTAHPLMGVAYATEEILSDSAISFAAMLAAGFRDEYASKIMSERISGTGAGEFEGILNSPAVIEVAKETDQEADTILVQNIAKMRVRAWNYQSCVWLAIQDAIVQFLQLYVVAGSAGIPTPIYDPNRETLLGRPVLYVEECSALGTAGDLILFNPREYLEADYEPLQSAESIHVRFLEHERAFKFYARNDGRCWWRTALTPKNGSTKSPIVTLADR